MAALLIAMSIMAVMMTVALPTWRQMSIREKEAELVFRGEQYARALALFQGKNGPGTAAPTFDLLVEQHYLRKKFKDPISNDDFVPIVLTAAQGGPGGQPGATPGSATTPAGRGGAPPGDAPTGQGTPLIPTTTSGSGSAAGTAPGAVAAAGIVGVTSKSKEQSIRLYKGRNHYNEWQFVPVPRVAAAGQANPAAGGARGAQNPFGGAGGRQGAPAPAGRGPFGGTSPPFGGPPANPSGPSGGGQPAEQLPLPGGRSGR